MTKERKAEICQYISEGMTRERAAMMAGIHVDTIYAHQKDNSEFSVELKRAESKCVRIMLMHVRRAAAPHQSSKERTKTTSTSGEGAVYVKGPNGRRVRAIPKSASEHVVEKVTKNEGHWQAAAWLLERRWPEDYGRVDRHLIHTTGRGTPLPSDYVAAISAALGYTGKLIPVDANAQPLSELPSQGEVIDAEVLPQD